MDSEQSRQRKREQDRQYHEKNREKRLQRQHQYRENNREKIRLAWQQYYETNHGKIRKKRREQWRQYYKKNHGKIRKYAFQYRQKNGRKLRQEGRQYYQKNRDRRRVYHANRKARLIGCKGKITLVEWRAIKARIGSMCFYCLVPLENPEIDHLRPFARGGENRAWNIVPACRRCNRVKGIKTNWTYGCRAEGSANGR